MTGTTVSIHSHSASESTLASLPRNIGEREARLLQSKTGWDESCFSVEEVGDSREPGNIVIIEIEAEHVTEVFTGFGEVGRPAEAVATHALQIYQRWLKGNVPVGVYLADQLLLPLVMSGGGRYLTLPPSRHSTTHIELMRRFLDIKVTTERLDRDRCLVRIDQAICTC